MTEQDKDKVQEVISGLEGYMKKTEQELEEYLVFMDLSTTKNPEFYLSLVETSLRLLEFYAEEAKLQIGDLIISLRKNEPGND